MRKQVGLLVVWTFLVVQVGWVAPVQAAPSPTPSACRACHDRFDLPHVGGDSSHAAFDCQDCHRHSLSPTFHRGNKTVVDLERLLPTIPLDETRLAEDQVLAVHRRCQECHAQEYKDWSGSPHSMTYGQSFLNPAHNRMEPPINDCLRCHAMFFDGSIEDLVRPASASRGFRLQRAALAKRPSIPCLSCHRVHPEQPAPAPLPHAAVQRSPSPPKTSTGTGFYDRREKRFFALSDLPHPRIVEGKAAVPLSSDPRLRNCYQCHAPEANHQAGGSDDRTPRGVHAGLSCLDCHGAHALSAQRSCAQCHPAHSHCGQEVGRLDTTARDRASRHDIHTVACVDCHPAGRPPAKP